MEKSHNEQRAELFGYCAELRSMEVKGYTNYGRIRYIMQQIPKLEKATRHYPEMVTPMFISAKKLLGVA